MSEKQRRERGSTLEREQRSAIEAKFRREGLSVKAAAEKYGIAEGNLRNALNGKGQDYETRKKIIDLLGIGEGKQFKEQDLRLFPILRRERNTYFTGREDTMKALYQELQRNHLAAVTQAISGMGGMGKTSTALEYAYRCLDEDDFPEYPRYKTIQFVRADTIEALKYGYADVANALQLPRADLQNLDEALQAVLRWMVQPQEAPWLLILDNADDPALLSAFLPNAERHFGHVLITSRSHHFTGRIKRIDIEAMEEEEGVTFLYRRTERVRITGSKEEQFVRALVAEMGGLPLALEQAAAYMTQEQVMPFEDYLTNFRDQKARAELMMHAPGYDPHRQFPPQTRAYTEALTVLTTWQMSLANLVGPHTDAVQLLYLSAYLHPVGIPRELVIALLPDYFAGAEGDAAKQNTLYNRLLNALTRYSFIQRNLENNTHNIHILVQAVLRDSMPPDEQKLAYERVRAAIVDSFPENDWVLGGRGELYYPHAEYLCNYAEQIGLEIERVGSLLHRLGAALYYQGRLAEAESYFQRALALRQKILPADHPDIAASLSDLAELYREQGRFAEAVPLYQEALDLLLPTRGSGQEEYQVVLARYQTCVAQMKKEGSGD